MAALSPEHEAQKRAMYEKLSPRQKKYIDNKVGYDAWNPFAPPKDPIDIRTGPTKRTTQQLINEFLLDRGRSQSQSYTNGALTLAMGLLHDDDRSRGMFDFSVWYYKLLKREGLLGENDEWVPHQP